MPCEPMRTREAIELESQSEPERTGRIQRERARVMQREPEIARDSRKAKSDPECAREGQRG